jgi:hypothetical protein
VQQADRATDPMLRTVRKSSLARRARTLTYLGWLVIGFTVLLVPIIGQLVIARNTELGEALTFVMMLWSAVAAMTFGFLQYRSRQYATLARAEVDANDSRVPVLYLRSFAQDVTSVKGAFALQYSLALFEEQLHEAFAPIGPLIAVGTPGQSLPPPGAHRIYVDDDVWRAKVEALMRSASLVVILIGKGGVGLGWEIERAFASVERSRLLLLVKRGRRQYEKDRKIVERAAGLILPSYRKVNRRFGGAAMPFMGRANCFLAFSAKADVDVLRLRAPWFRGAGWFVAEARYALKPIYEQLGVPWTPPPISKANVVGTTVLIIALLMIVLA